MPYAVRSFRCVDCGIPVIKRANKHAEIRCVPHAIAFHQESVRQLVAHSGPVYERWLLANLVGAGRSADFSDRALMALGR